MRICSNLQEIPEPHHSADAIAASLCYLRSYLNSARYEGDKERQKQYEKGYDYLDERQYKASVHKFKEVINIDPIYTDAHYGLGRASIAQGDLEAAEDAVKTALRLAENNYPDSQKLLDAIDCYRSGRNAVNNKQFNEAITEFQESIDLEPFFIDAHYELSRVYLRLGNLQVAKHVVEEALKLADDYPPIQRLSGTIKLYNAGINFLNGRQYNEAIDKFKETIDREPTFTEAHYSLGYTYFQNRELEAAELSINHTLELNINYQLAHALLDEIKKAYVGKGYESLARLDLTEAVKYRNKALQIDKYYQPAHELFESIRKAHYTQACDYLNNKQYDAAIVAFEETINRYPKFTAAHCGLCQAYFGKDNLTAAENSANEALRLVPDYKPALELLESITQAYYNQGCNHLENQRYGEAVTEFNEALRIDSSFTDTYSGLARAYLGQNKLINAKKYAEEAQRLNKNYQPSSELLEKIKKRSHKIIRLNNPNMILIPAGEFQMGCDDREAPTNEKPIHTVYLDDFYIDIHPVTNAQYKAFIDANPRWQKESSSRSNYLKHWDRNNYPQGKGDHPVTYVNWYAAMAYAQWVGKRLPTEAEWEKAARGGLTGQKYLNASKANYNQHIANTTPIGTYPPNNYGLYDMTGNVREWCLDEYNSDFYKNSPRRNPMAGSNNIDETINSFNNVKTSRVLRGNSWRFIRESVQVTRRFDYPPMYTTDAIGFRCAKSVTG